MYLKDTPVQQMVLTYVIFNTIRLVN